MDCCHEVSTSHLHSLHSPLISVPKKKCIPIQSYEHVLLINFNLSEPLGASFTFQGIMRHCQREGGEEKVWLRAACESELHCDPVQQRKLQFNLLLEYLNFYQLYETPLLSSPKPLGCICQKMLDTHTYRQYLNRIWITMSLKANSQFSIVKKLCL